MAKPQAFSDPIVVSRIKSDALTESSGIAASKCNSDVLWSHNDSGNDAVIFAISTQGQVLGSWKVQGAKNTDWEDIATYKDVAGKCYVYIGDTGDNKLSRPEHNIFRITEPSVEAPGKGEGLTDPAEKLQFTYPDQNHDCEALMVNPLTGDIYLATKQVSGPSGIYRIKPNFGSSEPQKAEFVAAVSVPAIPNGYLTGADIAPDARRLILCDYTQAYEFTLPNGDSNFDDIWKTEPTIVNLGKRSGGESVGYSPDGTSVFATSEGNNPPLIEVKRK